MPSSELSVVKLRSLFSSEAARALLNAVEVNEGQLNKISKFLRMVQSGACARFFTDHDSTNIVHLRHFARGSAEVHSFSDEFTPYIFDAELGNKLKLTNAASFRKAVAYIRSNLSLLSYLLDPLPLDTYSKLGKKKDDNIHQFWTLLITASNLDKTFSLGLVERSGHALGIKAREYFLSDSDTLIEIQSLNADFANLKMTNGVAAAIEEISGLTNSLRELGKETTNIEFYTKLLTLLSNNKGYLQTLCLAFKVNHSPPTEENTLKDFLAFVTNDKDAMAIRGGSANQNGAAKVGANALEVKNPKMLKKKERHALNRKNATAAMNSLFLGFPASSPSLPSKACIKYVAGEKIRWNDDTVGMHSDLNKIWNANTTDGIIDYHAFMIQLRREHEQGKKATSPPATSPPLPAPRRNHNVSHCDSLVAYEYADIHRCEKDDSVKSGSAQTSNTEPDEYAAQILIADSVDSETSA